MGGVDFDLFGEVQAGYGGSGYHSGFGSKPVGMAKNEYGFNQQITNDKRAGQNADMQQYMTGLQNRQTADQFWAQYNAGMAKKGVENQLYMMDLNKRRAEQQMSMQQNAFTMLQNMFSNGGGTFSGTIPQMDTNALAGQLSQAQALRNQYFGSGSGNMNIDTGYLQGLAGGPNSAQNAAMRNQALQGLNQQFTSNMGNIAALQGRGTPGAVQRGQMGNMMGANLMANANLQQQLAANQYNQQFGAAQGLANVQGQNAQMNYNKALQAIGNPELGAQLTAQLMGQNLGVASQAYQSQFQAHQNQLQNAFSLLGSVVGGGGGGGGAAPGGF
jgi:hypothetical protein